MAVGNLHSATPFHAVPDKSIVDLAIDLSDLEDTNIHLGEAELIRFRPVEGAPPNPTACISSVVAWLRKGCHATMAPLDGQDTTQMAWLRDVLAGVVRGLHKGSNPKEGRGARVKTGLVWKRVDGLDTDLLEEARKELDPAYASRKDSWASQASQMSARGRPESARIKPRTIVSVGNAGELDAVLASCLVCTSGRVGQIREDCVMSLVFHDEDNYLFSMLHVVVAGTQLSFLHLASLLEEIGQLHEAGQAGDFRLKSAEATGLNALACNYVRGDAKLLVVAYPQCEEYSFVSKIVSLCASSQTVWTDLVWLDVGFLRQASGVLSWEARREHRGAQEEDGDDGVTVYEVDTTQEPSLGGFENAEEDSLASCFASPSIESIRQSLQEGAARELSTAARRAVARMDEDESPTGASPGIPVWGPANVVDTSGTAEVSPSGGKPLTGRRLLFPSLRHSSNGISTSRAAREDVRNVSGVDNSGHEGGNGFIENSRDVFSSLRTIDIQGMHTGEEGEHPSVSITLERPATITHGVDVEGALAAPEELQAKGKECPEGIPGRDGAAPSTDSLPLIVTREVFSSIEAKINNRFAAKMKDLQERLEVSEMRRIELQSSYDVLKEGPSAGWDFSDHQSLIKSLQEEVKRSNALEVSTSSLKQEQLERDVEIEAKDKAIGLLRARILALESESDVSSAYELCEKALETSQEENRALRQENADLHGRLAATEVSGLMAANGVPSILPEDDNYDVDGAEARIIYKLHDKLKLASRRARRLEAEKEELRAKLQAGQRAERVAIVTKQVCEKLKLKVNALQKQLNDVKRPGRAIDVRCF